MNICLISGDLWEGIIDCLRLLKSAVGKWEPGKSAAVTRARKCAQDEEKYGIPLPSPTPPEMENLTQNLMLSYMSLFSTLK
jgi:hypothetical protein